MFEIETSFEGNAKIDSSNLFLAEVSKLQSRDLAYSLKESERTQFKEFTVAVQKVPDLFFKSAGEQDMVHSVTVQDNERQRIETIDPPLNNDKDKGVTTYRLLKSRAVLQLLDRHKEIVGEIEYKQGSNTDKLGELLYIDRFGNRDVYELSRSSMGAVTEFMKALLPSGGLPHDCTDSVRENKDGSTSVHDKDGNMLSKTTRRVDPLDNNGIRVDINNRQYDKDGNLLCESSSQWLWDDRASNGGSKEFFFSRTEFDASGHSSRQTLLSGNLKK